MQHRSDIIVIIVETTNYSETKTSKSNNQLEVEVEVAPINANLDEVEEIQVKHIVLRKCSKEDIT